MNRKLAVAVVAFLTSILVLQPAVSSLRPGLDGLAGDLARDGLDAFQPDGDVPDADPTNPFRDDPDFEPPGSLLGNGGGDFTPQPGAFGDRWSMDRSGAVGNVTVQLVCDPALGAMKRLKAYDGLEADYDLVVRDDELRAPEPNPRLHYDQSFTCTFPVNLQGGDPVPIYSPHPESLVEEVRTEPPVEDLRVRVDGAGTYHLLSSETREVTVTITYRADAAYWFGEVPASLTLDDIPPERRPPLPQELEGKAGPVLEAMNLTGERNLRTLLRTMQSYFLDFGEGSIPGEDEYRDKYHAIALGENGCCRHRAFAFHVTATSLGIPTRVIANEAHAYTEAWVPTVGWLQLNLGGCGSYDTEGDEGQQRYIDDADDPTRDPPREDPPEEMVPTTTTFTRTPETIRKGEPFTVEGEVRTRESGAGVGDVVVDVFLNETKSIPGYLAGRSRTSSDGSFRVTGEVPPDAPAGSYQLVAHGLPHRVNTTLYMDSWSDPPVEVTSSTEITFLGPRDVGVKVPTSLRAELTEPGGTPVPNARVTLQVGEGTTRAATTNAEGVATWNVTFPSTGTETLILRFAGDEHHDATENTTRVEVRHMAIQIPGTSTLVRGGDWSVPGQVLFDGEPTGGQEVEVWVEAFDWRSFGGVEEETRAATICDVTPRGVDGDDGSCTGLQVRTDTSGNLNLDLATPRDLPLGTHEALYTMPSRVTTTSTFHVVAQPTLRLDVPDTPRPHEVLPVGLVLQDDHGAPLPGEHVELEVRGGNGTRTFVATTDPQGATTILVPPDLVPEGSLHLTATYAGSHTHLETQGARTVDVEVPLWERIPLQPALVVLLVATVAAGGSRALRAAGVDPREVLASAWLRVTLRHRPVLRLRFPDIDEDLPDVWGLGEPLEVVVEAADPAREDGHIPLRNRDVTLQLDGAQVTLTTDGTGTATHEIEATEPHTLLLEAHLPAQAEERLASATRRRTLRMVDYRREVEARWEALRDHAAALGLPADEATTPRRLGRMLREAGVHPNAVEAAVTRFEVCDYSHRDVTREDYVAFHRATEWIRDDLDRGGGAPDA